MSSSTSPQDQESPPTIPDRSSSSSINEAPASSKEKAAVAAAIEKTISCVSCRRRKLKCSKEKPKCSTCARLKHDCEYPERRRNLGTKRRNMKELEARLAEVETRLVSENEKAKNTMAGRDVIDATNESPSMEPDWNSFPMDVNMDMDFGDDENSFPLQDPIFDFPVDPIPGGDFFSQEVISLGLQEPLPPDDMIDELHTIYFDKFHPTMPMLHKGRYLMSLENPPHMRPPIALRYAMWAMAASISDAYVQFEDIFYERSRKYIEQAEMRGRGEAFVSVHFAQAWGLISSYEAKKTYFTRAWMSTGRMVRLVHMLSLHRIDGTGQEVKQILPPARDFIELEERRRTFWAAFYSDRWASSGTGWPMIIDEKTILTNLPASEDNFESGISQTTISFEQALTAEGISRITSFGGVVLSACLFGHNFEHLHHTGPDEKPESLATGEFWKRHRKMDNILSNTFMFLPDHLRLPNGIRDMNVVFLHMNIHASCICLHQAAVMTAEKYDLQQSFIAQSRTRSLMAAEEIANNMRMISHLDSSNMNTWMGFCLYVASGVFIQDLNSPSPSATTISNLEFLLYAMKAIGKRHSITKHFTTQVELDISSSKPEVWTKFAMPGQSKYQVPDINEVLNARLEKGDGSGGVGFLDSLCGTGDGRTSIEDGVFNPLGPFKNINNMCPGTAMLEQSLTRGQDKSTPFNGILPNGFNRNEDHRPMGGIVPTSLPHRSSSLPVTDTPMPGLEHSGAHKNRSGTVPVVPFAGVETRDQYLGQRKESQDSNLGSTPKGTFALPARSVFDMGVKSNFISADHNQSPAMTPPVNTSPPTNQNPSINENNEQSCAYMPLFPGPELDFSAFPDPNAGDHECISGNRDPNDIHRTRTDNGIGEGGGSRYAYRSVDPGHLANMRTHGPYIFPLTTLEVNWDSQAEGWTAGVVRRGAEQ